MEDLQGARLLSLIAALAGSAEGADFSPRAFMLRPPEEAAEEREPTPEETAAAMMKVFGISR